MIEPSGAALFRILGPVEVWTGQDWANIGAGKQRSVIATLLLRPGEPVSLDVLIDEVWPDKAPVRAANIVLHNDDARVRVSGQRRVDLRY